MFAVPFLRINQKVKSIHFWNFLFNLSLLQKILDKHFKIGYDGTRTKWMVAKKRSWPKNVQSIELLTFSCNLSFGF